MREGLPRFRQYLKQRCGGRTGWREQEERRLQEFLWLEDSASEGEWQDISLEKLSRYPTNICYLKNKNSKFGLDCRDL